MAWIRHPLPGDAGPFGVWFSHGRWLVSDDDVEQTHSSADLDTWSTHATTSGFYPHTATADGARWYASSSSYGAKKFLRSTDMAGAGWAVVSLTTLHPGYTIPYAEALHCTQSGRLLAYSAGHISSSDDGGDTWTYRAAANTTISGGYNNFRNIRFVEHWGVIVCVRKTGFVSVSTDDGETWTQTQASLNNTVNGGVIGFAPLPAGWLATFGISSPPRISTDQGATWTDTSWPADYYRTGVRGGRCYLCRENFPNPLIYYSDNLVDWTQISTAFFDPEWLNMIVPGDGVIVGELQGGETSFGLYSESIPADLEEPIPPEVITLDIDIDIVAAPTEIVSVGLSVTIAPAESVELGLSVSIVDASAVAGLGGAGGWPACPSGQWASRITLDGVELPAIIGAVRVTHARREASTAEFAFLPTAPMLPTAVIGRRVGIAFVDRASGATHMLFTGVVQDPSINLNTGVISCLCSNNMQESLAAMARGDIDAVIGGSWHSAAFPEPADGREYIEQIIRTVPADYAIDVDGTLRRLDWYGPTLRTATVEVPDYLDQSLQLTLPQLDAFSTRCVVKAEYRYTRTWARGALAQYSQPVRFFLPDLPQPSKLWLTSEMIESAVGGVSGWTMQGAVSIAHPEAKVYNLGSLLDPYLYIISPNVAPRLATGFSCSFAARWTQTVTEYYEIAVVSPALETTLGRPISAELGATLTADFDQPGWDADVSIGPYTIANAASTAGGYGGAISTAVPPPLFGDLVRPYQPAGFAPTDRNAMISCLLDQARCDVVMRSARSGGVTFDLPLRPDMWLDWYVTVDAARLQAAGAVEQVTHDLDHDAGSARTTVELAVGLPGSTTPAEPIWTIPEAVDPTPPGTISDYSFTIDTYVGGVLGALPFDDSAMVGFCTNFEVQDEGLEYYPHKLTIESPQIRAEHRDPAEIRTTAELAIDVHTDTLELL